MFKQSLFLYALLSAVIFTACDRKNPKTVTISATLPKSDTTRFDLTTPNLLTLDTMLLGSAEQDTTGKVIVEIALDKPLFAYLVRGNQHIGLFLSPGDEVVINADTSKGSDVAFSGDGASVNSYLKKWSDIRQSWEIIDGKFSIMVEPEEFNRRQIGLKKGLDSLTALLEQDKTVRPEALDMIRRKNKLAIYYFNQNYAYSHYGTDINNPDIPANIRTEIKELPQDTLALSAHIYDYGSILQMHLHRSVISQIEPENADSPEGPGLTEIDRAIAKMDYPPFLKMYFRAASLQFWVAMDGIKKEYSDLRGHLYKELLITEYRQAIDKTFEKWQTLAAGKPAPDFTGITSEGKSLSLSSLKGKLIYVDVWATWCKPCREEFPDSKKLVKEFEGNDQVAFLFVSVDQNVDTWKKLLPDKSIPSGVHINVKDDGPASISSQYYIRGIPRYMLIDKDGKMLEANAARPSSGEVAGQISKYLQAGVL